MLCMKLIVVNTETMYSTDTLKVLAGHLLIDSRGFETAANTHPNSNKNERKQPMLNVTRQLLCARARPACQIVAKDLQLSLGCE